MPAPLISLLPVPPTRQDPANFSVRADNFLLAFPMLQSEVNSFANYLNTNTIINYQFADGTVTAPTINFQNDTDTGLYRIGANNLGVAAGGTKILDIATTGVGLTGNLTVTGSTSVTTLAATGALTLTGGTANGVAFLNGSKVLTTGSALTFDGTNLSIGVVSPAARLDVAGTVQTSAGYYVSGNTSGGFLFVRDNFPLRFGVNDTERARITSGGNLLVGTALLTQGVSGAETTFTIQGRNGTDNAASVVTANNSGTGITYLATDGANGNGYVFTKTNTPLTFGTNNTERARITSGGNLLVGTTVDIAGVRLQISGGSLVARGAGDIPSNSAIGEGALISNTTGFQNTANGVNALANNTTGINNTANGVNALLSNTTGNNNTANGFRALLQNTTGVNNTANGRDALQQNTTGINNTANGVRALFSNTTGFQNTANGVAALENNTTGLNNTANGLSALRDNTTGNDNTASGVQALLQNTTGSANTANGVRALFSNTTGSANTANGVDALRDNTTGGNNFAIGVNSGNDAVRTITTQSNEGVLGNNNTTAIFAKVAVTVTSDIRDKTEVAPVPLGLSFVNAVNPISYRFRKDRQSDVATGRTILGFSAQELLELQGNAQIIDNSDPENLKINSSDLIAVLFNAVKELSIEVQTLKSKLGE